MGGEITPRVPAEMVSAPKEPTPEMVEARMLLSGLDHYVASVIEVGPSRPNGQKWASLHSCAASAAQQIKKVRALLAAAPASPLPQASPSPDVEAMRRALEGLLGWHGHDEGCATDPEYGSGGECDCGFLAAELTARAALSATPAATEGEVERLKAVAIEHRQNNDKLRKRVVELTGALEANPPIALDAGSWFYPEGDTSSDECRFSPYEVIDYAVEGMDDGETAVVCIERALSIPAVYASVRIWTDAERAERGDDEHYSYTLHADADAARQALEPR